MLSCTKATTTEHRCVTFELLLRDLSYNCQLGKKVQKACRAKISLHWSDIFCRRQPLSSREEHSGTNLCRRRLLRVRATSGFGRTLYGSAWQTSVASGQRFTGKPALHTKAVGCWLTLSSVANLQRKCCRGNALSIAP